MCFGCPLCKGPPDGRALLFADHGLTDPWCDPVLSSKHVGMRPCVDIFRRSSGRARASAVRHAVAADRDKARRDARAKRTWVCVARVVNAVAAPASFGAWHAEVHAAWDRLGAADDIGALVAEAEAVHRWATGETWAGRPRRNSGSPSGRPPVALRKGPRASRRQDPRPVRRVRRLARSTHLCPPPSGVGAAPRAEPRRAAQQAVVSRLPGRCCRPGSDCMRASVILRAMPAGLDQRRGEGLGWGHLPCMPGAFVPTGGVWRFCICRPRGLASRCGHTAGGGGGQYATVRVASGVPTAGRQHGGRQGGSRRNRCCRPGRRLGVVDPALGRRGRLG